MPTADEHKTRGDTLSLAAARRHDQLCDEFEARWRRGPPPCLEETLASVPPEERAALFVALLRIEIELRPPDDCEPLVGKVDPGIPVPVDRHPAGYEEPVVDANDWVGRADLVRVPVVEEHVLRSCVAQEVDVASRVADVEHDLRVRRERHLHIAVTAAVQDGEGRVRQVAEVDTLTHEDEGWPAEALEDGHPLAELIGRVGVAGEVDDHLGVDVLDGLHELAAILVEPPGSEEAPRPGGCRDRHGGERCRDREAGEPSGRLTSHGSVLRGPGAGGHAAGQGRS